MSARKWEIERCTCTSHTAKHVSQEGVKSRSRRKLSNLASKFLKHKLRSPYNSVCFTNGQGLRNNTLVRCLWECSFPEGSLAAREWQELVELCLHPPPSLSCVSCRAPGVTPLPSPWGGPSSPAPPRVFAAPVQSPVRLARPPSAHRRSPGCSPSVLCAHTQRLPVSASKPLPASGLCTCRFVCLGCPTCHPTPLPQGLLLTLRLAPCMSLPDLPRWVTPPAALSHEPAFFTRVLLL